MEVGILSSKPENRDDLTQVDSPELPPTHSSLNKINSRNIHSASFGSASSTCSSNSSSSLSTNGMAYTPAIRGHRDKYASSGRTINSMNDDALSKKKSSISESVTPQCNFSYGEHNSRQNGHNVNLNELDDMSNEPKSLEEFSHGTPIKLRERKKSSRISKKNMNGNADNLQPHITYKPISQRTANSVNTDMSDLQASNSISHSVSPGSNSGRSSTSSLNNINQSMFSNGSTITTKSSLASQQTTSKKDISVMFNKKVSINETPAVLVSKIGTSRGAATSLSSNQQNIANGTSNIHASNPSIQNASGVHRASIIQTSERRARKVRFFINSDRFFKGATIAVSSEKFRTFDRLLEHLSRIMCNQVTLPNGVRFMFALDGRNIEAVEELLHGENYVCSSSSSYKNLDYLKMAQEQDQRQECWKGMKRDTYYIGMGTGIGQIGNPTAKSRRDEFKQNGQSKSFRVHKSSTISNSQNQEDQRFQIKPKIIAVLRSGLRPRKAVRVLLNNRNTKSFDIILADLTSTVKLDTGAVRKVFNLDGKPVACVSDFAEAEVFIAYGGDKCSNDDFDLDMNEFRNVQSILKSPALDKRYERFSTASGNQSPSSGRRKFLQGRSGAAAKRRARQKRSPSKGQGTSASSNVTASSPTRNGSSSNVSVTTGCSSMEMAGTGPPLGIIGHSLGSTDDQLDIPAQVSNKYNVGDIIGDGNFAVVRRCVSKRTRQPFALKIIDKSKCQGKEHMIESEIAILNLVSHSHIIELIEVFDFPDEKYLVTELVPGGDLFDAIASDVRYSEFVSRRMVADLTSALQYLHDKMIVHRDIKPENLLVVNLTKNGLNEGTEAKKSLKLGDFGLAQLVSEPLFTVCGTPTYVAPEILAETGYGVKVDVWATGVIMYILLVGFPPFSSRTNNQEELFDQILSGLFEFNSPDWDDISYPAKELISWMLQVDPLQRYSAYEILQHPWIKGHSNKR